jgi:RNA 3'-terminal phosphate cyclase-like protein
MVSSAPVVELQGHSTFRHQIVCSILSNKPVKITAIHADSDTTGLRDYEANFLKFIARTTNGGTMQVGNGRCDVTIHPGLILGGTFTHEVPTTRSVMYIVEAAMLLLPFAKFPSKITFTGATQHALDLSPDTARTVTLRWLQLFGIESSLRIVKRGAAPGGEGVIIFEVKNVRKLKSANITERGKVKRVRGIAFASNTASDLPKNAATAAKGVLLDFLPDVYVVSDVFQGRPGQQNNGYGVMLVAESTSKTCLLATEATGDPASSPEEAGSRAAELLLEEVADGGCVDSHHQMLVLLLMALNRDEVSTVRFGKLSESGVSAMSLMETFFAVSCAIKEEGSAYGAGDMPKSIVVSCIGSGTINLTKRSS